MTPLLDRRGTPALPGTRYLEVRYEHLVRDTAVTMAGVLDFLGEPFDAAAARFDGKADDFDKVYGAVGHRSSTLERLAAPMTDSRIGVWRDSVGADEIRDVLRAIGRADARALFEYTYFDVLTPARA